MTLTEQLPALVGVMVGGVLSYLTASLADRGRWKRGLAVRWDERRLSAYIEYASAVNSSANLVVLILAGKGILPANTGVPAAEGLRMLSDAEGERSLKFAAVLMLGDTATLAAATDLGRQVYRLYSFARGDLPVDAQIWAEAYAEYRLARQQFHRAARASLGVPAASFPQRSAWLEHLSELQNRPEDSAPTS